MLPECSTTINPLHWDFVYSLLGAKGRRIKVNLKQYFFYIIAGLLIYFFFQLSFITKKTEIDTSAIACYYCHNSV